MKSIKNFLLFSLALALFLSICSCGVKSDAIAATNAPVAEETLTPETEEPQEPEPIVSTDYKLDRVDNSIKNDNGNVDVNWFFDKLIMDSSCPGAEAINADMEGLCSEFFNEESVQQINDYYENVYHGSGQFMNFAEGNVSYNGSGVISVNYTCDWFMGGVFNENHGGYTYDLNTGDRLSLADVLGDDSDETLAKVQEIYWNAIAEHYGLSDDSEVKMAVLAERPLDDYKFYVGEGGEIFLMADTYEFAPGAAGSYVFASGLLMDR